MGRSWLIAGLAGFCGGIFLRSFVDFGWALGPFFVLLGLVVLLLCFMVHGSRFMVFVVVFVISAGLGVLRYDLQDSRPTNLAEGRTVLEGVVVDEPDERENYTRLTLGTDNAKVILYANRYPEYHYGDKIKAVGLLEKTEYFVKDNIYFEMFYPEIDFISSGHGSFVKEKLFGLKESFIGSLNSAIPEPNSSFMAGLTVGAKKSMGEELLEDFRKTGVVHIVVLSGYNITLVADFVMKIFGFLPSFWGTGLGALAVILFTIMTGAGAATVRASIMALLVVLARATGRIYRMGWALFLVGFLMILHNPKILRFDASFQLSFLATLALIYLAPYFEQKLSFVPKRFHLQEIVSATLSTQIFVLPLLLYKTGVLSFVSLPANLLILPFIPVTMFDVSQTDAAEQQAAA